MGTNWSTGSSVWTWGRTSALWGWRSPGTGCPGRLWSLLLWRYSRPAWTRSCVACCRWPSFSWRVGLDDPQRSLPTPNILWFCDSVVLFFSAGWRRQRSSGARVGAAGLGLCSGGQEREERERRCWETQGHGKEPDLRHFKAKLSVIPEDL